MRKHTDNQILLTSALNSLADSINKLSQLGCILHDDAKTDAEYAAAECLEYDITSLQRLYSALPTALPEPSQAAGGVGTVHQLHPKGRSIEKSQAKDDGSSDEQ